VLGIHLRVLVVLSCILFGLTSTGLAADPGSALEFDGSAEEMRTEAIP
jgi:hypothetical protein